MLYSYQFLFGFCCPTIFVYELVAQLMLFDVELLGFAIFSVDKLVVLLFAGPSFLTDELFELPLLVHVAKQLKAVV